MKKLYIIFCLACIAASANAQIKWYDIESAFTAQKSEPKKIMIDMYTSWCGFCKQMDKVTFANSEIIDYLNKNYYCVKFDAETAQDYNIGGDTYTNNGKYGSFHELAVYMLQGDMSFPSVVFFDENGEILTYVKGYIAPQTFLPILSFFGDNYYQTQDYQAFLIGYNVRRDAENKTIKIE